VVQISLLGGDKFPVPCAGNSSRAPRIAAPFRDNHRRRPGQILKNSLLISLFSGNSQSRNLTRSRMPAHSSAHL
jgi:hypothetical protein